jgi:hypothetical protein
MKLIKDFLTTEKFEELNREYPESEKKTAARAEEIVKIYFKETFGEKCSIELGKEGSDLRVRTGPTDPILEIDVKGTASNTKEVFKDIAWDRFYISSNYCHDKITKEDMSIYRVVGVYEPNPRIYVLKYGPDFKVDEQPRWKINKPDR